MRPLPGVSRTCAVMTNSLENPIHMNLLEELRSDRKVPRHRSEVSSHVIKCRFVVSAVTYPHFIVPTKAAAFVKASFINLEMNEMGIGY